MLLLRVVLRVLLLLLMLLLVGGVAVGWGGRKCVLRKLQRR